MLYWQHRCMHAAPAPGRVVYEDDPAAAAKLLGRDPQYVASGSDGHPVVWFPRDWEQFYARLSPPGRRPAGAVLSHTWQPANGPRRLVVIEARSVPKLLGGMVLDVTLIDLGSLLEPPRVVNDDTLGYVPLPADPLNPQFPLRVHSAGPDPADPSHLEFDCYVDGQRRVMDVWLRADGSVGFEPRAEK